MSNLIHGDYLTILKQLSNLDKEHTTTPYTLIIPTIPTKSKVVYSRKLTSEIVNEDGSVVEYSRHISASYN